MKGGFQFLKLWMLLPFLSLISVSCAVSELRPKSDTVKTTAPAKDKPSRMIFVERDHNADHNIDEIGSKAPIVIAPTTEQEEILQLMRYSRVMHSYPKVKVKEEFKRVANAMANDDRTVIKIQMAILLSVPKTSFANEHQAAQLLTEIVNDANQPSSSLQEYAYLLLETIQQREEIQKLQNELMSELHKERQKRAQLQEQLNALKSIEKSISQRQHNTDAPADVTTEAEAQ